MSEIRTVGSKKKKKKKLKKKFLLTSKKCWLLDETLIPLYRHLVDRYSDKVREEWIKVEETDIEATPHEQEPPDDNLVEIPTYQVNSSTNQFKVHNYFFLFFVLPKVTGHNIDP